MDNNRKPKLLQTGHLSQNFNLCESSRIILDTGATAGNYVTRKLLTRAGWDMRKQQKVNHHVRLGDGETAMQCQYSIQLDLTLKDSEGVPNLFGGLNFFIIESDKDEVIIGIDSLLGPLFDFLIDALKNARQIRQKWQAGQLSHSDLFIIDKYVEGYWNPETNDILIPFLTPYTISPEEEETPLPESFSTEFLNFMEKSVEESRQEYFEDILIHVSPEMISACPKIIDLLKSDLAQDVFAPKEWPGLKVDPVDLEVSSDMPKRIKPPNRPIRKDLYEHTLKEFNRLTKYLYVESDSEIASALVVAPKATAPFIRICGDYRPVNPYISLPQ